MELIDFHPYFILFLIPSVKTLRARKMVGDRQQILTILSARLQRRSISYEDLDILLQFELNSPKKAAVFGIDEVEGRDAIRQRYQLFLEVYPAVETQCGALQIVLNETILLTFWDLWLPLAMELERERNKLGRALVLGILGGQGTGKTTLTSILGIILAHLGKSSIAISLDDLYKNYLDRQQLQQEDPRLKWRGPPPTHDVELGVKMLDELRENNRSEPISIPRFDKYAYNGQGDRSPDNELINPVDIVLFEGWFVGVEPVAESAFLQPPPPIVTPADIAFAKDTNNRLNKYLSLWQRLDKLMIFYHADYRYSKEWRKEAEHKAIAAGKAGMDDQEIDEFVDYFWIALHPELFIRPLLTSPRVDLVVEINKDRSIGFIGNYG
jgi:D-glycerate 3-kinase